MHNCSSNSIVVIFSAMSVFGVKNRRRFSTSKIEVEKLAPVFDPVCLQPKKGKKGQKLSCVKLAICPDHPRRRRPLKFCIRSRVREVVIYFKFHENRYRGLGAVGGRKSPSPIDKAHGLYNSLYYRTSRDDRRLGSYSSGRPARLQ